MKRDIPSPSQHTGYVQFLPKLHYAVQPKNPLSLEALASLYTQLATVDQNACPYAVLLRSTKTNKITLYPSPSPSLQGWTATPLADIQRGLATVAINYCDAILDELFAKHPQSASELLRQVMIPLQVQVGVK